MKLFQHSNGALFAFGFDMDTRSPDPRIICWSDQDGKTWEATAGNSAGFWRAPKGIVIAPEFVYEANGRIVVYQPGLCIEMDYVGPPFIWAFRILNALPWVSTVAA
jgi:hypothetical protein